MDDKAKVLKKAEEIAVELLLRKGAQPIWERFPFSSEEHSDAETEIVYVVQTATSSAPLG